MSSQSFGDPSGPTSEGEPGVAGGVDVSTQPAMTSRPTTVEDCALMATEVLTTVEQQSLPAAVVQGLETADQQRAATEEVVSALPFEAKEGLAAAVVQSLETADQQRAAAEGVVSALPTEQKQQVYDSLESTLGTPDRRTRRHLWYIVVGSMVGAIFIFGVMAFVLIYQGKAAEAPLALATTALGGVVGLVATSPGSGRSD